MIKIEAKMKANQRKMVQKLKRKVKKEESFLEKCKEYDEEASCIDDVKIVFEPMDISAKTVNGDILLNEGLLDRDFSEIMRYVIHEMTHVFQQDAGKVDKKVDEDEYLDDENELEAFQAQLQYMDKHESPKEIQQYLERLLDHHDIKGKERIKKIRDLTEDI